MENIENDKKLLCDAKSFIKDNDIEIKKTGNNFNIFSLLNVERNEVGTHSKMIYSLLNPYGKHCKGDIYLKLFLKYLGIEQQNINKKWKVEREFPFEYGRIDFILKCQKMCIAIEMKIDAGDQQKQLKRYDDYVKVLANEYRVCYLTLDGKDPSEQSWDGVDKRYFMKISFKNEIIKWLGECLEITPKNSDVWSAIKQYYDLCNKIVCEESMMKGIKELINDSEMLRSAIAISNILDDIKTEVLVNFMDALEKSFIQKNVTVDDFDREAAKNYYMEKTYPALSIVIKEMSKNLFFCLNIEVNHNLYFNYAFMERRDKEEGLFYKSREEIEKKQRDIYNKANEAIKAVFEIQGKQTKSSVYWDHIYDVSEEKYDFKHFSDNCIGLKDNYAEEAERISEIMKGYIDAVKKNLK